MQLLRIFSRDPQRVDYRPVGSWLTCQCGSAAGTYANATTAEVLGLLPARMRYRTCKSCGNRIRTVELTEDDLKKLVNVARKLP